MAVGDSSGAGACLTGARLDAASPPGFIVSLGLSWTISARIDSATSGAVRAPRSRPAGKRKALTFGTPLPSRNDLMVPPRFFDATRPTYSALLLRATANASSS
jgi:hypothetical protein